MSSQKPDELWLSQDPQPGASNGETPQPLRIMKQPSSNNITTPIASASSDSQPTQQWAQYKLPPPTAYGPPLSPPPTTALPNPESRWRPAAPSSRSGTPAEDSSRRRSMASSDASSGAGSGASGATRPQRARFDANDPNRPTGQWSPQKSSGQTIGALAQRRGTPAKNVIPPDSPGGPEPPYKSDHEHESEEDDEGLGDSDDGFFHIRPRGAQQQSASSSQQRPEPAQQYYPPPLSSAPSQQPSGGNLKIPSSSKTSSISRLDSTASTSTTKAARGSPPPPETPATDTMPTNGLSGIEARYAASQTANAAAARRAQYVAPTPQQQYQPAQGGAESGRWSPTERPGSNPHGPPIMFQGNEEVRPQSPDVPSPSPQNREGSTSSRDQANQQLESDFNRMGVHDDPPPAYAPPAAGTANSQYPNEKGRYANRMSMAGSAASASSNKPQSVDPNVRQHPAFANDALGQQQQAGSREDSVASPAPGQQNGGMPAGMTPVNVAQANQPGVMQQQQQNQPISPPPLPEGWIAHLDNNSGQYYYIHLPTQSTQWEFPKGPTPLNFQEPMSPTGTYMSQPFSPASSVFKQPLSPGFPVHQSANASAYDRLSMAAVASPTTAGGFTGPPPSAGVDMYKVAPTNGVYFGPYLRYTNLDLERGLWLGSIMLISDAQQPPTIHIHQSMDLSPNPRQLKAHPIHSHQRWVFYRYDVDIRMDDQGPAKWTYAITSHLGCTRYEFLVAGRYEYSWRFVAHSGNDFALNVSANERSRLGGIPLMWKDVLVKHQECGGFHAQIGLGGQIYADRLWKDISALKQWTQTSGKENRRNAQWTAKMDEDVTHAFFHYYTSHFDQPAVREAFAQIPQICCLDDHDIFDGYGSYPEYMQNSHVFKNIGRIGIEMFLLFQHHTTHEILRNVSDDVDLFTITGTGWHFVKYLGPNVVVVGPDTRSERNGNQVLAGPTYQGLFPKIAVLPPSVQHCIWLLPVPIVYPRLEGVEQMANTVATGKKFVTGGFNMAGKVVGGLAGVVGAKGVVNSGFDGVKKAVGKSGLMQGVLSPFGEIDMLDELRDMWTHESKDLERTYLIRTLQGISHNKCMRMTFLSGSVNVCGAGLVHDPSKPSDHKTMYQLISASIVNAPTPGYVLKLLHNNKPLYIPQNGHRSTPSQPTDTKEDMMEIFAADVDGRPRELRRLMGRRNYLACVVYDPATVGNGGGFAGASEGSGKLSLAADFMVQNEGAYGQPMKYGPVVIPSLEYGR